MPSMSLKERVRAETSSRRRTVPAGSTSPTITSEKTTTWHKIYETSTNDFFYRVSVKSTLVNFPPHVFFFFFQVIRNSAANFYASEDLLRTKKSPVFSWSPHFRRRYAAEGRRPSLRWSRKGFHDTVHAFISFFLIARRVQHFSLLVDLRRTEHMIHVTGWFKHKTQNSFRCQKSTPFLRDRRWNFAHVFSVPVPSL